MITKKTIDQYDETALVLITHIPKCAGTSLEVALTKAAGIDQDMFFSPQGGLSKIIQRRDDFRYLRGHWPFRVECFFHPLNPVRKRKIFRIATFREPLERILSYFYFQKQRDQRSVYNNVIREISCPVEFYQKFPNSCNQMTRQYLGYPLAYKAKQFTLLSKFAPGWIAQKAYSNLKEYYAFYFFQDTLSSDFATFSKRCGLSLDMTVFEDTVTHKKVRSNEINESMIIELKKLHSADFILYDLVQANKLS